MKENNIITTGFLFNPETEEFEVHVFQNGVFVDAKYFPVDGENSYADAIVDAKNCAHDLISNYQPSELVR